MSPYSATSRSVFFGPLPPISSGMSRVGAGFSLASRSLILRQRAAQIVEPAADGAELVAVFVVILFLPTRSDAQNQPATRDVVDGAGHIGQQLGVAIGVAGHQRADLDARGLLGPGAEHRPAFVVRAVRVAVEREEVVPVEGDVDADVFTSAHGIAQVVVVAGVLRLQLDADADRPVGGSHGFYRRRGSLRDRLSWLCLTASQRRRHPGHSAGSGDHRPYQGCRGRPAVQPFFTRVSFRGAAGPPPWTAAEPGSALRRSDVSRHRADRALPGIDASLRG